MKKHRNCGVYVILNTINNKRYVGASVDIDNRFKNHERLLRTSKHFNKALQSDFIEFGARNFQFLIIDTCPPCKVREQEQYFLDCMENKYNIDKTAKGPTVGNTRTESTKKKQKEAAIKRSSWDSFKSYIVNKRKKIRDSEGNLFSSLTEAAKFWNISRSTVCDVLKGRHNRTREGVRFSYEEV